MNFRPVGNGLPGLPPSITRRQYKPSDRNFEERKRRLLHYIEPLSPEELRRADHINFHAHVIRKNYTSGYQEVSDELRKILAKEQKEKLKERRKGIPMLSDGVQKFESLNDCLRQSLDYAKKGRYEYAVATRKIYASHQIRQGDLWLGKVVLTGTLPLAEHLASPDKEKFLAEVHTILAYISTQYDVDAEAVLAASIDHLATARGLARHQSWILKPNQVEIVLEKPIVLHGFRISDEASYEKIDGCSMSLYMIATLMEHGMLMKMANKLMNNFSPEDEDIRNAHEFADLALQLAWEVRHPVALASSIVKYGLILRHSGAFFEASKYFEKLFNIGNATHDVLSIAIAFHNLGLCMIGNRNTPEALDFFIQQKELCEDEVMEDLEADALTQIGHLLLHEGHLWEAEECQVLANEKFSKLHNTTQSHEESSWALVGLSAGQKLWPRLAGLIRKDSSENAHSVLSWRTCRQKLIHTSTPIEDLELVEIARAPFLNSMGSKHRPERTSHTEPVLSPSEPAPVSDYKSRGTMRLFLEALKANPIAEEFQVPLKLSSSSLDEISNEDEAFQFETLFDDLNFQITSSDSPET